MHYALSAYGARCQARAVLCGCRVGVGRGGVCVPEQSSRRFCANAGRVNRPATTADDQRGAPTMREEAPEIECTIRGPADPTTGSPRACGWNRNAHGGQSHRTAHHTMFHELQGRPEQWLFLKFAVWVHSRCQYPPAKTANELQGCRNPILVLDPTFLLIRAQRPGCIAQEKNP